MFVPDLDLELIILLLSLLSYNTTHVIWSLFLDERIIKFWKILLDTKIKSLILKIVLLAIRPCLKEKCPNVATGPLEAKQQIEIRVSCI